MKALFWTGVLLLMLGLLSLLIPLPRHEREGFRAGDVSIGIETHHKEPVPPVVSAAMILSGAGLMFAGKRRD